MDNGYAAQADRDRVHQLKQFLRGQRLAIPPGAAVLGTHERLPIRLGKRVSQEELAEAIGISRVWYCVLECGGRGSVSPRLLDRLAKALMLSSEKRRALFYLALPELAGDLTTDETRSIMRA